MAYTEPAKPSNIRDEIWRQHLIWMDVVRRPPPEKREPRVERAVAKRDSKRQA